MNNIVKINGHSLTLRDLVNVARNGYAVEIEEEAIKKVNYASSLIQKWVEDNRIIYGVTTGFGDLATVNVDREKCTLLQENLLRSHAVGVGDPLPVETVRAIMLLRLNGLTAGHSGITLETLTQMVNFLNLDIIPHVPSQGSVGASGDLCPLSHIAVSMLGEGDVFYKGVRMSALEAMSKAGLKPIHLHPKEGLALNNGTAALTGLGALALWDALTVAKTADIAGALSVEALHGVPYAFDERTHAIRPHQGQIDVASNIRKLIQDSQIIEKFKHERVQDAYSLRCIPIVHGASRNALRFIKETIELEMNSVTDNPLIFPDSEDVISGGNFHGQPIALPMDFFGIAVAELGSISERRVSRMVDKSLSNGLPPFIIADSGVNSGFMISQYTAAAVVSENKTLAHPASVDSIPTSANQEDHVSMGYWASLKGTRILENVQKVLGIEILSACQGIDFSKPLTPGKGTKAAYDRFREEVPYIEKDVFLYPLMDQAISVVKSGALVEAVEKAVGELA
ncbi:histidine ammonia-lyase [Dethiosulfovibrio peptidovorans DSM 11002]|uniref:Histidine ammonia-lyase n=1 Tax=Dethiosulfovibrio peptidovorans DSM 11002 TaxID=469381 RepID=D2Z7Z2_9BACT|nr:histidine ammonia-lyase [Dethiosulfovibrio peptidovorans DSM 11002]